MWAEAVSAVRDLGRLHDIARVLVRYGFGDLVRRIGLAGALERAGRALKWNDADTFAQIAPPMRVRRALEELGPSFIKLGQIASTRVDLFPPEWTDELGKLQDAAPALPYTSIHEQLTHALGAAPESIFARLDTTALAAASLAQVHRAWLADGTAVVLKVRRPGIGPTIEADLRLLARLAMIIEADAPELRRYRPREVVRQFSRSLRRELDFSAEARSAERIAANFAHRPDIVIPRIHWQWTSEQLNVQDCIEGIPGHQLMAAEAAGLDRKLLARRGANAVLQMILENGFFHADPHPGNLFYLPGNRIAFIDFGMVGRLSEARRHQLAMLLDGLASRDSARVADILLDWSGNGNGDRDMDALEEEIDAFVDQYHGVPLKALALTAMLSDLVTILREHELALPPDLALLIKTFITLEGLGRRLDPDFDMVAEAKPFLQHQLLAHTAPTAMLKRGWRTVGSSLEFVSGLPRDLRQLLRAARQGTLQVKVDVVPLQRFGERLDRAISRLALSIVTAALIIGSAIILTVDREAALPGGISFGWLGFGAAVVGGLWVLLSIWRATRRD
ncbi:ubiquinone biosynthesis protein UbiB [Azoarcus sp. L1K30]|uniref:ABC1 kinase family protein n=1 Tax=Azoarcus sp. L1K30 TaxID=2820277 RepID=UPI001B833BD1|nr:AarF/UbiB family protein [Azoarcus sp. L1K30]MBR0566656.1 ubiquinone biosynthesis protein UbiB [Azoarcus sp. L1K30]